MSRLHTVRATVADIAAAFGAEAAADLVVPSETVEGQPGLVVYERGGMRRLKSGTWGFPRLTREMRVRGEEPGRVGMVAI